MSVQKVISNYYTDLLDFLNSKYRKFDGNFSVYLDSLNLEGKKKLLNKIASVYQRIYILKGSQESFFKVKRKNYTAYMIIFSFMIVIMFCVLYWLAYHDITKGEVYTDYQRYITYLTYIIIFLVFFTILLLLILNVRENKRRIVEQMEESRTDLENMKKLFPLTEDEIKMFEFIGFKYTESSNKYNSILKANPNMITPYIITGQNADNTSSTNANGKKKQQRTVGATDTFNYEKYFNDKKADGKLLNAINQFYDYGKGYNKLREEIVSSSNFLIMKEFRNIMKYYYKIVKRKENSSILTDNKKIFDALDKYVVKDLLIAKKVMAPPNPNAYNDPSKRLTSQDPTDQEISNNMGRTDFKDQYDSLLAFFNYIIVYMYQVKVLKKSNDPTFDQAIKTLMPQEINLSLSTKPEFDSMVKTYFTNHFQNYLEENIGTAKNASANAGSLATIYGNSILQFKDAVDNIYQFLMITITGNYLFPFDPQYMKQQIQSKFNSFLNGTSFDQTFATTIIDKISTQMIPKCYNSYQVRTDIEYKKSSIVTRIASNMQKFDVKVVEHSQYIYSKMDESGKLDGDIRSLVSEMLSAIDRDILQKKASAESTYGKRANDQRFLDLDQFIEEVDKITYNDLKVGLNYEFYSDILDRFYFAVNNAIYSKGGTGNKGSKDIYFQSEKKFLLGKVALIFTIVTLGFIQIYHLVWTANEKKFYDKAKAISLHPEAIKGMNKSNVKELERDYADEYVNIWMKRLIPIAANVFFICLLISIYNKNKAKYTFNKETIDGNTSELRSSLNDMRTMFDELDDKISQSQRLQSIKNISQIGLDEKTSLYNHLKVIIDKFEKCNYVLASAKNDIPFPYTEVIIDGFMLFAIATCVLFVVGKINPLQRIKEIKVLNKLKEKGEYMDSDAGFADDLITRAACHDSDIDTIMFTLKIMFFMFIVMFLIFYSSKVISSTSEFQWGIYNSVYFEESMCLD